MTRKKMLSKRRVVLAGLLLLCALRTSIVLASPSQADNNGDGKVSFEGSEMREPESRRDSPPYPKNTFGEDIRLPQTRQENAMHQLEQRTPFDSGDVEDDEESISLDTDEDENVEESTISPATHLKDNGEGTVADYQTGLMWTKDANLLGDTITLRQALDYLEGMNAGKYPNFGYTDWRLPNMSEFQSLIDYRRFAKIGHVLLYRGHPFQNVQLLKFNDRSLTTYLTNNEYRWFILFYCSLVGHNFNSCFGYLWPVRGGK